MNNLFKIWIRYEKLLENEKIKKMYSLYLFEAVNFSDAETLANEAIEKQSMRNAYITSITRVSYEQIIEELEGVWYEVSVDQYLENEAGKEQIVPAIFLMLAAGVGEADKYMTEYFKEDSYESVIKAIKDSKICDYFKLKIE